jgi:hypothetical protein
MQTLAELPYYRAYESLAKEPPGGLMELPFATQQSETTGRRMLLQTVHGKPIMAGYLARRYDSPIIDSCGPFWGFISPLDVPRVDIASPLVVNRPLDVLNFYDIHYVSLYPNLTGSAGVPVDKEQMEAFEAIIDEVKQPDSPQVNPGFLEGGEVMIDRVSEGDADSVVPSFHVGAGWYTMEEAEGEPFRWLREGHGSLCVFSPRDVTGSLMMEGTAFAQERGVTMTVGGELVYRGVLTVGQFIPIETEVREWKAGITQIEIVSPEAGRSPNSLDPSAGDDRVLTVGFRGVTLEER